MGIYVGVNNKPGHEIRDTFKSAYAPTKHSHGHLYNAVIGPFRTVRGANFMRDYGQNNPHLFTVADAERCAKQSLPRPVAGSWLGTIG